MPRNSTAACFPVRQFVQSTHRLVTSFGRKSFASFFFAFGKIQSWENKQEQTKTMFTELERAKNTNQYPIAYKEQIYSAKSTAPESKINKIKINHIQHFVQS